MAEENMEVSFEKQINGYNREQVDSYIEKLADAYQAAYDEITSVYGKYNELLEKYREMEARENGRPSAEVITNTLMNTEMLAQKILKDANQDAAETRGAAQAEAKRIVEEAYVEKAGMMMQAEKIMERANAEAFLAKQGSEQSREAVKEAIFKLQSLLPDEAQGAYLPAKPEILKPMPYSRAKDMFSA